MATWREAGLAGCARKVRAAAWMGLPLLVAGRRTAQSVGAYFDLRIARRYGCRVTGVNFNRERVRQGCELIAARGLSGPLTIFD